VRQALDDFQPTGHVLEVACGTGLWTEQLAQHADHITALDASAEVIALNQERVQSSKVTYIQTDIFAWQPSQQYDLVFFSFWLSHVPSERFADFWEMVAAALKPDGHVFFVDSRYDLALSATDHHREGAAATTTVRRLNDGREFRIVKIFYQPTELMAQLEPLQWQVDVQQTERYFIYGAGNKI
jgi:demethylmenaquinone methyltransferase/2-methoxy-6-polyprenyl-1,4-benzoquinol methylase